MSEPAVWAWLATMAVVSLSPGAGAVAAMSSGAAFGWRKGIWTALGLQISLLVQWSLAVLGVASLLRALPGAFSAMQILGVLYLSFIGLRLIIQSFREEKQDGPKRQAIPASPAGRLLHGFLVNATNPKALLALFAIAPRFLDPSRSLPAQAAIMGVSMVLIDFTVMCGYTAIGARLLQSLKHPRARRWSDRVFGGLFLVAAGVVAKV